MMLRHQLHQTARARQANAPANKTAIRRVPPRPSAAAPTAATTATTTAEDAARAFAAAVTGEWEGVTATFSPAGDALDLPERFVPQAFREWDMVPKDWQSQCSVPPLEDGASSSSAASALPSSSSSPSAAAAAASPPLRYAARRMMPTVGCEADAVAFTEDMAVIGGSSGVDDNGTTPAAVLAAVAADGAYAAAPARLPADGRATVRVEACFPLPESSDKAGRPERLRVVQTFTRDWTVRVPEADDSGAAPASPSPASLLRLEGVELHREFREGDYTARVELLGCGGGSPPISGLERTAAGAVGGGAAAAADAAAAPASASSTTPPGSLTSPSGVLTLLPLGAWSYVRRTPDGDGLRAEAGVAVGAGQQRRRVIAVEFAADGALSAASIVDEA